MTSEQWYCRLNGETAGPFSLDELEYLVLRGRLTAGTAVRRSSAEDWVSADRIPELFPGGSNRQGEPEESPLFREDETSVPEDGESDAEVPDLPDEPDASPPPIPKEGSPVGRSIAAGAAAVLMLLLLAMLFWRGDGGEGTARGTGGNATGTGAGTGNEGDGAAGDGGQAGRGEGSDSSASQKSSRKVESGQEKSATSGAHASDGTSRSVDMAIPQGTNEPPMPTKGRGDTQVPSSEGESPAEEKRKPIPRTVNAVVYDGDRRDSADDASDARESGDSEGASGGPGSEGTFFGIKAKGRKFVYIVDRSGSMSGGRFARAREELIRSVKDLTQKQSFYVFLFSNGAVPMFDQPEGPMCRATTDNIARLETWVDSVRSSGGTDPTAALQQALKMKPDAVFLLSDGEIPGPIPQLLQQCNSRRVPPSSKSKQTHSSRAAIVTINTIGFENTSGERLLKQIAAENDGEYRFISIYGWPNIHP